MVVSDPSHLSYSSQIYLNKLFDSLWEIVYALRLFAIIQAYVEYHETLFLQNGKGCRTKIAVGSKNVRLYS